MICTSLKIITQITNGVLLGDQTITIKKIVLNSKNVSPKSLFLAIIGKKFDAHDFCKEAINKGCSALLVQRKIPTTFPQIIVKNTLIALKKIAKWNRDQFNPIMIAITGSLGKTSVKEITANILNHYGHTLYTQYNYNNAIGVAITLLNLNKSHQFAVIELGASKPGEIYSSVQLVRPFLVLINNIYPVHLQGFKSLSGIARSKQEIFSGLSKKGIAILNEDSNNWSEWKNKLHKTKVFFFSIKKKTF
ncbi:hypothetical protein HIC20_02160 [Buchnera aphidicola (Hormaphis cornu)]|nr:hypothetical protein HIC20_02160 [Buchnera aphidicola (Hormaphis cornu)]